MKKMEQMYAKRKLAASIAGAKVGEVIAGALTDLSAIMAKGVDPRVMEGAPSAEAAAEAIAFDFDLSARINAIAQIIVPVIEEIAVQHEKDKSDCFQQCAEALLHNCLMEALDVALVQSASDRESRAQGKVAEAMLTDPDPDGSAVAEAAKSRLEELLDNMRKGR